VAHRLVALAVMAALSGCATIVAGGPDTIPINTNPPGAYVYLNGQVVGQTPMMLELDRDHGMADIRIYYPGFQPVQITRYKSLNGWVFGNFFLAIWPVIIDLATGNWQRFDEEPIILGLTPGQAAPPYGMQPQMPMQPQPPMQPPAQPQPPMQPPTQPQPPPAAPPSR
jgi:hypothetical protein